MKKRTITFLLFILFSCGQEVNNQNTSFQENFGALVRVEGVSMEPLMISGSLVYYQLNPLLRTGDIVIFTHLAYEKPYIKIIKATSQNTLTFIGTNLEIEGELMKNSAGDLYEFSVGEKRLISLYIKNGHIPNGTYLVFGDNLRESRDSRKFGVISEKDIIGKVIQ